MHRFATVTLLSLALGSRALACSCEAPEFPDSVATASAIYRGKVVKSEPAGEGLRNVTFTVAKTWKGKASPSIVATHQPSVCEAGFVVGSEYLVLESEGKPVTVDICSSTKLVSDANRELTYLDKTFSAKKGTAGRAKLQKKKKKKRTEAN